MLRDCYVKWFVILSECSVKWLLCKEIVILRECYVKR